MNKYYKHITNFFSIPYPISNIIITLLAIILIRFSIEHWIDGFVYQNLSFYIYGLLHNILIFTLFFIACVFLLKKIALLPTQISINISIFTFLLILLPPLVDWIISVKFFNGNEFLDYYLFDNLKGLTHSFITFFGNRPRDGITYGTRTFILFLISFLTILTWSTTKNILRAVSMLFSIYVVAFIASSFPSLIAYVILPQHFAVTKSAIAGFVVSPTTILGNQIANPLDALNIKMSLVYLLMLVSIVLFISYKYNRTIFISLLKNIRPVQTFYHIGLLIVGMYIAIIFDNAIILPNFFTTIAFILLCIAIIFAWYSTVIFNDCVDQKIDIISNKSRPLIQGTIDIESYKKLGILFFILSLFITILISKTAIVLLLAYHALSFIYNTKPLRLKKVPVISSFIAAIASFFIVLIGFITISPDHSINNFPHNITILLIISYTISLPIKDLKDVDGDKKNNIYTLPVLFGIKTSRIIIAVSIFFSFMLSIFTLGTNSLLLPALLAGTLSFWTLVGQRKRKFIFNSKRVLFIIFLIVSLYSVALAFSIIN